MGQTTEKPDYEPVEDGDFIGDTVSRLQNSPQFQAMLKEEIFIPLEKHIQAMNTPNTPANLSSEHPGRSEYTQNLDTAFCKAFGEITSAIRDTNNPHIDKKYASLESCYAASRQALSSNGLAIRQFTIPDKDPLVLRLVTKLVHESGQWESSLYQGRIQERRAVIEEAAVVVFKDQYGKEKMLSKWQDTTDPQAYGIFMTYMRRYQYMAMIGLAPADDIDNRPKDGGQPPIIETTGGQGTKSGGAASKWQDKDKKPAIKDETMMPEPQIKKLMVYMKKKEVGPEEMEALFGTYKIKKLSDLKADQFSVFLKSIIGVKKLGEEKSG